MTFGELKTLVWSWLDDPNAGYFTDAQVSVWLNNGQKEVQKKLIQSGELWWAVPVQSNTVASTGEYSLPSDFVRLHKLQIVVSGTAPNENLSRLGIMTPVQEDEYPTGLGLPSGYYIRKNCLVIRKTPDRVYVLKMLYSPQIVAMTVNSQTPDMPDRYHEAIALEACQDGFLKDQRDPNPIFKAKWDGYMEMLKQDSQNRNVDSPREVVVTECDNRLMWGG